MDRFVWLGRVVLLRRSRPPDMGNGKPPCHTRWDRLSLSLRTISPGSNPLRWSYIYCNGTRGTLFLTVNAARSVRRATNTVSQTGTDKLIVLIWPTKFSSCVPLDHWSRLPDNGSGEAQYSHHAAKTDIFLEPQRAIPPSYHPPPWSQIYRRVPAAPPFKKGLCHFCAFEGALDKYREPAWLEWASGFQSHSGRVSYCTDRFVWLGCVVQGYLRCVPMKPSTDQQLPWPQETVPTVFYWLGLFRFIAWRLRCHFLGECQSDSRYSNFGSYLAPSLKRLCAIFQHGVVFIKYSEPA